VKSVDRLLITYQPYPDAAGLQVYPPPDVQNFPSPPQYEPPRLEARDSPKETVCGLDRWKFWALILLAVIVVAAGVGGGIGGGYLAGRHTGVAPASTPRDTESGRTLATRTPPITTSSSLLLQPTTTMTPTRTQITPDPCINPDLHSSMTWAGIPDNPTIRPFQVFWYDGRLLGTTACCHQCYSLSPQKCNLWGYNGCGGLPNCSPSCYVVYNYPGGDVDAECPAGRPSVGFLTGLAAPAAFVAATGPCAGPTFTTPLLG
jgi:hypothetical protein